MQFSSCKFSTNNIGATVSAKKAVTTLEKGLSVRSAMALLSKKIMLAAAMFGADGLAFNQFAGYK